MIFLSPDLRELHVTILNSRHSSQVASDDGLDTYIRLKSGVCLTPSGENFLLGLPTRALLLTERAHAHIARNFNGLQSVRAIAQGLRCDMDLINSFAELLKSEGLADQVQSPSSEPIMDLSEEVIALRSACERELVAHRPGVRDAGEGEFLAREGVSILISGENRLARHLLVALHASGFTNTRLISRARLTPRITGADLCGIVVRASDIGKLRKEFSEELIRNSQISRSQLVAKAAPDLIISTVPIEWDYVQRWMSEGSLHFHINQVIGGEIEIGPLVVPGKTPCLRCIALTKRENGAGEGHSFMRSEASSAACAYLSGLIALALAQYFATGATPLHASSRWYDLLDPLRTPEIRHWNFHPECGCN